MAYSIPERKRKRNRNRNRNRKRNRNRNQNRDWSGGLPSDVLAEIMSRLTSSGDRVRFGAVCSSWRRSAKQRQQKQHPPWLMLPGPEGVEDEHRSLYSLSERKLCLIHLPQIQGHNWLGSGSDGDNGSWLVTVNNLTCQLQLLHFLNGNGNGSTIPLPSITTLTDVRDVGVLDPEYRRSSGVLNDDYYDAGGRLIMPGYMCRSNHVAGQTRDPKLLAENWYFTEMAHMHHFFKKAIFFPSASLVFVIYNVPSRLAFARLGKDDSWKDFDVDCSCIRDVAAAESLYLKGEEEEEEEETYCCCCLNFRDVVFHKGQFYAICSPGWLLALHLPDNAPPRCTCLVLRPPPTTSSCENLENENNTFCSLNSYLVESPDGEELMQVRRYRHTDDWWLWSSIFAVFKCKLSGERRGGQEAAEWVEVKCLDECVLFLGENMSLALSTRDFPELAPNSIYFTDTQMTKNRSHTAPTDMGVFHLDSRTIEPVMDGDESSLLTCTTLSHPLLIPHIECFPFITQFNKYMVEELKIRKKPHMREVKQAEKFRRAMKKKKRKLFSEMDKPFNFNLRSWTFW